MKHRRDPGLRRDDEIWKPCFSPTGSRYGSVIASEEKQSRAVYADSGLLSFARNDDGLESAVRRELEQPRSIHKRDRSEKRCGGNKSVSESHIVRTLIQ